ncbi:hypothetical protein [Streptomyces sp. NPDC096030]|uniref:hypothetical protein n=1 Tax=Streptomyces sp. NPDC096030 TaxID=3155423 RepID=UPI0033285C14
MARGGRPQGAPRGATDAANALAQFLRELTDGMGVREMAERYEGGKTLWGEYRSGARIIPLGRLNAVVRDRVRDARGREAMLAKARRLYEKVLTAEEEQRPSPGLDVALRQAEQDIDQMGRLITVLLARIDTLERAPEAAAASVEAGQEADVAEGAQLVELRSRVSEAQQVHQAARKAYAGIQAAQPSVGDGEAGGEGSEDLLEDLARLHASVTRNQDDLQEWQGETGSGEQTHEGTSSESESGSESGPKSESGPESESESGPESTSRPGSASASVTASSASGEAQGGHLDSEDDSDPAQAPSGSDGPEEPDVSQATPPHGGDGDGPDRPPTGDASAPEGRASGGDARDGNGGTPLVGNEEGADRGHPRRVRLPALAALCLAAACVAGGIVIGLRQTAPDTGPDRSLRVPAQSPTSSMPDRGLDVPGLDASSTTLGSSTPPPAGTTPPAAAPVPSRPGGTPRAAPQPPGTLYTVTSNRKEVLQWTADKGWTAVGGIAGRVYAGPAGVFATNPHTGDIYTRNQTGAWRWIGSPGAQFLVHGDSLYALTPRKDAVMRWTGEGSRWENIGGPASALYAGGAGLFAVFPGQNNDLYRYGGPGRGWTRAGGPGSEFAIGPDYIAGLAPDRSQIWMADSHGSGWHKISGPAGRVHAGGAGLFATDPGNGKLLRYSGTPHSWTTIGAAGTAHDVDDRSVYRIAKNTGAVERWTGRSTWTPLGRTASDIDTH